MTYSCGITFNQRSNKKIIGEIFKNKCNTPGYEMDLKDTNNMDLTRHCVKKTYLNYKEQQ